MPARDIYHDAVRHALEKDGWTITHDPLRITVGSHEMYVDLGAERLLAAERGELRIAVEVKSFLGGSPLDELEKAVGQYSVYRAALAKRDPKRTLYLAVPVKARISLFASPLGELVVRDSAVRLVSFDPVEEVVEEWLP